MKIFRNFKLSFDRSFSTARFRQFTWLLVFLLLAVLFFYIVNGVAHFNVPMGNILELILDPGNFSTESPATSVPAPAATPSSFLSLAFQFFIAVFGAVFFTGVLISIISNMLEGRVDAYKKGLVRYQFSDHILILGANEMVGQMVASFMDLPELKGKDIVILTNKSVEDLYSRLYSELDNHDMKNLTLLFGNRDSDEDLRQLCVDRAERVYILGESHENEHDALNISCCERVSKLCARRTKPMKCFMLIDRQTSYHIFQYQTKHDKQKMIVTGGHDKLQMTIINSLENWAQQVLVTRAYKDLVYPSLDNGEITKDSRKRVHLVVIGMTQMALSFATTAAHIAHYPNFKEGDSKTRTKITFIAPRIEQEMNFFKGRYHSLFELSHSTYTYWDEEGKIQHRTEVPKSEYGDFLDVEWEFVDAGVETEQVRALLRDWSIGPNYADDLLRIAVCEKDPVANIAIALYLPEELSINQIPIFVYQPTKGKILEYAHQTQRYTHIYPFGMMHDCYDRSLRTRIKRGQRIAYLYYKSNDYVFMTSDSEFLDQIWYDSIFAHQLSNVYAANSIPTKLRSLGLEEKEAVGSFSSRTFTDDEVEILARMEHNRWNMEKLLVGFRAMSPTLRESLSKQELKDYKNDKFIHTDIRRYDDLPEGSKDYDRTIVRHLYDVIKA